MSAHTRAARRERQAAELLGSKRVLRSRYESAPDVEPVMLPCGVRLVVEVKTRKTIPGLVTAALRQAAGYGARGDVAAAVLSSTGEEPVIVLPLRAFRRIAGLEVSAANDPQVALALDVELGADERRVLAYLRDRLLEGQRRYGALDLARDPRDWKRERAEECADLLIYGAFAAVKEATP